MSTGAWRVATGMAAVATLGCAGFAIGAGASSQPGGGGDAAEPSATAGSPGSEPGGAATTASPGSGPPGSVAGSTAPDGGSSAPGPGGGEPQAVTIVDFEFLPPDLSVAAGSTITWTNDDDVTHNVLSDDEVIKSPDLDGGDTYEVALEAPGTVEYKCDIHQFMRATITVTE